MRNRWFICATVTLCLTLIFLACVETEVKRTTKKVDVSKAEIAVTDPSKPHLRISLQAISPEQNRQIAGMLQVEIDDGVNHYALMGGVFVPTDDSSGAVTGAPWVNVPDSGELHLRFALVDSDGVNVIGDAITIEQEPGRYYRITLGVFEEDPCELLEETGQCRNYTLPKALQTSEGEMFALLWTNYSIADDSLIP